MSRPFVRTIRSARSAESLRVLAVTDLRAVRAALAQMLTAGDLGADKIRAINDARAHVAGALQALRQAQARPGGRPPSDQSA